MARSVKLPNFPTHFKRCHASAENLLTRIRKFEPQSLFLSVLNLAVSTNGEGYNFALERAWAALDKGMYQTPAKSSLSEARDKVSYEFFEEIFKVDVARLKKSRKTYRGYFINAVDGSDLDLPASDDVLAAGYRGSLWSKKYETHYPKMHVVHAYDVLSGMVTVFKESSFHSETALAATISAGFDRKSLTIYDRIYCGHPTFKAHIESGSLFLVRAKTAAERLPHCVRDFLASDKVDQAVIWKPTKLRKSEALDVRLIKIRHPKTREISVFVTNAPRKLFSRLELGELYLKRWEIEVSFKDLVSTLKMDQLHSKTINGIKQEIYSLLWISNAVKMQMHSGIEDNSVLDRNYIKSNFKLCVRMVVENIDLLFKRKSGKFFDIIDYWSRKTREKRRRRARSYPRVVRSYGTGFSVDCKVLRSARDA